METVSKIPESNTSIDPRRSIQTNNNPASFIDKIIIFHNNIIFI